LFLTPSAVTRQIQRLEAALDASLLDRRVKPARITRAGRAVLDRGRHVLRVLDELKASASTQAEPSGVFRLGLAHALEQPSLVASLQRVTNRFGRLRPVLTSDLTQSLAEQVKSGDLDVALGLFPAGVVVAPSDVDHRVLATERFVVVRARGSQPRGEPHGHKLNGPWVVNPRGCMIRHALEAKLQETGIPLRVAAEIHNIEMQLSLVASGIGTGIVPARFLAAHARRRRVETVSNTGVELDASVVFIRAGHLGRLDTAATFLEQTLREHFAARRRPLR
jgi:DNA-binding transcriptional LysR family regulator